MSSSSGFAAFESQIVQNSVLASNKRANQQKTQFNELSNPDVEGGLVEYMRMENRTFPVYGEDLDDDLYTDGNKLPALFAPDQELKQRWLNTKDKTFDTFYSNENDAKTFDTLNHDVVTPLSRDWNENPKYRDLSTIDDLLGRG